MSRKSVVCRVWEGIKKEAVFSVATLAAVISCFFVKPTLAYFSYIDYRVLVLLLCLMLVIAGFRRVGAFRFLADKLLKQVHSSRGMELILILLCFFLGMLITNDVALITFVPFTISILLAMGWESHLIYVITLETVAANLGSMVTPIGNPQNLYLYTAFHMNLFDFFLTLLPYALVSLVMLCFAIRFLPKEKIINKTIQEHQNLEENIKREPWRLPLYCILFLLCLLCVIRVLDYRVMGVLVILGILLSGPEQMKQADYMLLLTFVSFFIFVGNLKEIPVVSQWLAGIINGHEVWVSVVASQVISNVPAAVLLSGFTENVKGIMVGTDIGGLGTIIASMASLISFRAYGNVAGAKKGKFLGVFTGVNVVFLGMLLLVYLSLR